MLIMAVMSVTVLINEGGPLSGAVTQQTLSVMEQSSFTEMATPPWPMTTSAKAPF